jgi:CheY-like chemotaxis protein
MPSVLFADADRELHDVYTSLLSAYGFQVETAGDGLECLAKLRQSVPDLLILDVEMLWGGGDGILEIMRKDPQLSSTRVVLTSAAPLSHAFTTVTAPPVVRTLTKPFVLSAVLNRVSLTPGD